jgi:hypothetical protein
MAYLGKMLNASCMSCVAGKNRDDRKVRTVPSRPSFYHAEAGHRRRAGYGAVTAWAARAASKSASGMGMPKR